MDKFTFKKPFLLLVTVMIFLMVTSGALWSSSAWGHVGQSVFLLAIEMPQHPEIYKPVFGDELYSKLTSMGKDGKFHFDLDNLNPEQKAFTFGAVGPDKYDITQYIKRSKVFFPLHNEFPQRILNLLNDITMKAKGKQFLVARAYFYGWAFHYMGDLVFHPGMNIPNKYRVTRDFEVHGSEHVIFESLLDKISVYYWFLKHRELGIYPSKIIKKVGFMKPLTLTFKMTTSNMHRVFKNVNSKLDALCKTIFSKDKKTSENAFKKAMMEKDFLSNALYDKSLKKFVKNGVPEEAIMNGQAKLSDYFPKNIHAKTSAMEGVRWFKQIIESARIGFPKVNTRKGFNLNLDYGTVTSEPPLKEKDKKILFKAYNKAMNKCMPKFEHLVNDDL